MLIKQGEKLINARNWGELVRPEQVLRETSKDEHGMYGQFSCEPLERGYGCAFTSNYYGAYKY